MRYSEFQVIPAVDVLGTEAVRLLRGDYEQVTLREADPFALIERVCAAGAEIVHVVDLEAARGGRVRPELVARAVAAAAPARVQTAGGVRSTADAEALVEAGADRVVVGTAAFTGDGFSRNSSRSWASDSSSRVDVRDGFVAVAGWTPATRSRSPMRSSVAQPARAGSCAPRSSATARSRPLARAAGERVRPLLASPSSPPAESARRTTSRQSPHRLRGRDRRPRAPRRARPAHCTRVEN